MMFVVGELEEIGMETTPVCKYLSRVVDLPLALAEAVFDNVTRSLGPADQPDLTAIGAAVLPARRIQTRLRAPFPWRGVPVEVELTPWSRGRTEVGVRYGGSRRPRAIGGYVYETQAPRLLDEVTDAINARLPGAAADRRAA